MTKSNKVNAANVGKSATGATEDLGNTKTKSTKETTDNSDKQYRNWCFTWNNYPENYRATLATGFGTKSKYIYQQEKGDNGTPHLQGYVEFGCGKRLSTLKKIEEKIHWEPRRGSKMEAVKYCSKKESRDGEIVTHQINLPPVYIDPMEGLELYPWQTDIVRICNSDGDQRRVNWYYEPKGCSGKTTLAKHIVMQGQTIYVGNKSADVKCAVARWIEEQNKGERPELRNIIFNFVRSMESFVSYDAIESCVDGIFFSSKYESDMCYFNPVNCIIFANFHPDTSKLSADRWNIVNIGEV